ncbi:1-acylglycerol-3-phosphate O-acyltransferase ABHD5 [Hydra vulgaris]|uniref:1-acylglycerol-3-phosphate O-acyltransferase ABHD5 n=1 Tax=Hydra vulgaris TaxID=6087 RepID=A0ABM4DJZ1_HYDVU
MDEMNESICRWSWKPTSRSKLAQAEQKMLENIRSSFRSYFVPISNNQEIRTVETDCDSLERLPLVMVHGFGAGIGFWTLNLDELSKHQKVYAFDLLGFGRSSRPSFPADGAEAENFYVQSIEEWREKVNLKKFVLLGHSFGAYLACSYTIKYPERVEHLILADPWGIPEKPPPGEENFKIPIWAKVIVALVSPFNPLAAVRAAGPWGPSLVSKARPDLKKKYECVFGKDDDRVFDYIYHCNAQFPSGEMAFKSLSIPYGWAKYPMIHRIKEINANVCMTVLFGSRSWMDTTSGYSIKYLRYPSEVNVKIINGAGHHIFADSPSEFNTAVLDACKRANGEISVESIDLENK